VVEGRVVASLARALSVCFIYQYETINRGSCQEFFKHPNPSITAVSQTDD